MLKWVIANKEWIFSGLGVALVGFLVNLALRRRAALVQTQSSGPQSTNIQSAGNVTLSTSHEKPSRRQPPKTKRRGPVS